MKRIRRRKLFTPSAGGFRSMPKIGPDTPPQSTWARAKSAAKTRSKGAFNVKKITPKTVKKHIKKSVDQIAKKAKTPKTHKETETLTKGLPKGYKIRKPGLRLFEVPAPEIPTMQNPGAKVDTHPASEEETSTKKSRPGQPLATVVHHKVSMTTGRPTTKVLQQLAKLNGTTRRMLYDTKANVPDVTGAVTQRSDLTHSCGFNSRNFWCTPASMWANYKDMEHILNLPETVGSYKSQVAEQTLLASLLSTTTQLHIYNQNSYHSMNMKIHLVKLKESLRGFGIPTIMLLNVVGSTLPDSVPAQSTQATKIPPAYLHSGLVTDSAAGGTAASCHWDQSLKGRGLTMSSAFRRYFDIVHTCSKKLQPNEHLQFQHTHHFGGGVNVTDVVLNKRDATNTNFSDALAPLSYFYIIETKGYPCEAIHKPVDNPATQYLGTNPCYYTVEARKYCKFVRGDNQNLFSSLPSGSQANVTSIHYREFTKEPQFGALGQAVGSTIQREFFALPDNITDSAVPQDGETVIPVLTDKLAVTANTTGSVDDRN